MQRILILALTIAVLYMICTNMKKSGYTDNLMHYYATEGSIGPAYHVYTRSVFDPDRYMEQRYMGESVQDTMYT